MKKTSINIFLISFLLILLLITLCQFFVIKNYKTKNYYLVIQNDSLEKNISSLNSKIKSINFGIVCEPINSTIKIGEEYTAYIHLAANSDYFSPVVKIENEIENLTIKNTDIQLYFNSDNNCFIYKFLPTHKGVYVWGGVYEFTDLSGKRVGYPFFYQYNVE